MDIQAKLDSMKEHMEDALAWAEHLGASAAKIAFSHGVSHACNFEAGRLKSTDNAERSSYGISVVVNGKNGTASGNDLDGMRNMVQRAVELAQIGADAHFTSYPKPVPYKTIKQYSESVLSLTRDKMIDDCQEIRDCLKQHDDSLDISVSASQNEWEWIEANNAGLFETGRGTAWSLSGGVQKTVGTDVLMTDAGMTWGNLNELYDKGYIKQTIIQDLDWAENKAQIPDGHYPVLSSPAIIGSFLTPFLLGLNGRNVYKGISPLKDQLGKAVAATELTLEDNPFVDYSPASEAFDSAGIPTQRRFLIKDGVLQLFLYDWDTAGLTGKMPTGNTACRPTSVYVQPGQESSRSLLASIKRGVYIKKLLGFGQGNIANGDFSCNVALGFVIENGEIVGRLKDAMIAGNILDLMKGDIQLSSEVEPHARQPFLLLPNVAIVSAKG